ncbi:MAG TPA: flagellar protein FlaG [Candidatus Sumerlaeota bacterium]|nr:flagellar protein FlaG [Candidatus Sumerlaeota bacterium]HPK03463.1 flagellar protein FlaG [Candidatus Sumerlaeota bacterium]
MAIPVVSLAYGSMGLGIRDVAAPSSASGNSQKSPRQTDALLPTELAPVGQGASKQDVSGTGTEQTRLVDDIRQTAEKINEYLRIADTHLEFSVSEQTGRIVVHVIDSETREIVREIPPETMNRFAKRMTLMRGLLFEASG